jgi:DNA (cytosine-5)-methyltransferase 1
VAVYYNEIDPFAAEWLRQLMKAKCIPAGDVDQRSITDILPKDLKGYKQCHFFAGIGGWPYALSLAGWGNKEVWTGSCPCQPFSNVGSQFGVCDQRHLWPAWQRLIAKCRPSVIFGEQVASQAGRHWFAGVRAELEALAYAVGAANLRAAGIKARHDRKRLFFVAYASSKRLPRHINGRQSLRGVTQEASAKRGDNGLRTWVFNVPTPQSVGSIDGLPRPVGIVRGFGNAIVPQAAAWFIQKSTEAIGLTGF